MLQPGTRLDHDRYHIEAVIGHGGFGYVYRARERLTGEVLAIKELVPSFMDDREMVQRFIQEARATLRLTHPHIVRTHTIFEDRGTYYLAMEYLSGGSLADKLEAGPLSAREAVRIARDVCDALAYAHQEGVVHCDIKPANVLFDERGRVRLADFGIAHVSAELLTRQFFTTTGTALGTVRYMAPEQLEGVRDDPRVDIYAVGAVLYEMLAGRPYLDFDTESTPAAQMRNMQRIQSESPRPLRVLHSAVPEWLDWVVMRALHKAPEDRFPQVRQLRRALQGDSETRTASWVPRSPPTPTGESWAAKATAWVKNLPGAAAVIGGLVAIALLACGVIGLWYVIGAAPTPPSTPSTTPSPTRSATLPPPTAPTPSQTHPPAETPTDTPIPDRDDDGVPDKQDRCPDQSGSPALAGCPDSDGDGIPDLDDECPASAGLSEFNGCHDTDGDGIGDHDDRCPYLSGPAESGGCPVTEAPPTNMPMPDAPPADASQGDTWIRPTDGAVMVYVPAGEFEMGSSDSELDDALEMCNDTLGNCKRRWFEDEQPMHRVLLHAFWIDRNEVTVSQFAAFVEATGHETTAELTGVGRVYSSGTGVWQEASGANWKHPEGPGSNAQDTHAVVQVSWRDARAYCSWVSGQLPTEAEWEYAARGPDRRIYPWGNSYDATRLNSCDINCPADWRDDASDDGYATTAPVGRYPSGASWCGALDMAGNVWEWVADRYSAYSIGTQVDPVGPSTGDGIARGGGWGSMPSSYRTAQRHDHDAESSDDDIGFRCVVVPER